MSRTKISLILILTYTMNLRTSRVYLPFFFLLTLISCEKPSDIGVNLPGQNQLGTHFEVQTAQASTVLHPDSILAFRNEPIVVGKVSDGVFGTISATHYTEIGLNGNNSFTPGTNPNPTLELILAYSGTDEKSGFYYGDTTVAIKLNVYKLSENFQETKTYFINDKVATESALLGSITFEPMPNRTAAKKNRMITIPLDQAFANQLLTKSFATQEDFRNFWKGIAISPDPSSAAGSLIGFTTLPDSANTVLLPKGTAGINLTYTDTEGKTKKHNFTFAGQYFNGLEITRQGALTALDKPTKELPASATNKETYIQANTGVKTKLVFPGLENFKENKGNIFINHAELVIPVKKGSFNASNPVTPLPKTIFLYESKLNNRVSETSGGTAFAIQAGNAPANGFANPAIGNLIEDSLHYSVNITSYVQAVIAKQKANNGIIITPTAEDNVSAQGAGQSFPGTLNLKRALIDAADNKIKLRIYYSKLQ